MQKEHISLLLVEDNPDDALLFEETVLEINQSEISGYHFDVRHVQTFASAREQIEKDEPDVMLLDLSLPDSHGMDTVIKAEPYTAAIPIIILTGLSDSAVAVKAIKQGIQDFIVKGSIMPDLLFRSVLYAIERHKMVTVMQSLAMVDELTGLYNRRGFLKLAHQNMNLARRRNYEMSLLFADLDCMKKINDSYGHKEGDRALKMTAAVLKKSFRDSDISARIGGDEFVVMAAGTALCGSDIVMGRLEHNIKEIIKEENPPFDFSLSFGFIQHNPQDNTRIEDLLEKADELMYEQKKLKKSRTGR